MSTTATIFNSQPSYTVVGGQRYGSDAKNVLPLSILLLNRGGKPFRGDLFEELSRLGVREVISVEGPGSVYDVENLSRKYGGLRFILLQDELTPGEQINIGITEAQGEDVFVLWNDMKVVANTISSRLIQKILERHDLCTLPLLHNEEGEEIPTLMAPVSQGKRLRILPFSSQQNEKKSIMPFDYCGIYNKEKFQLLGGFDPQIKSVYWQKVDFGFRGFLWGEIILVNPSLKISYLVTPESEDSSTTEGYRRFFLKNLAVRYRRDSAYLPGVTLFPYLWRSSHGFLRGMKKFGKIRDWVHTHRYRFKQDSRGVIELWDLSPDGNGDS